MVLADDLVLGICCLPNLTALRLKKYLQVTGVSSTQETRMMMMMMMQMRKCSHRESQMVVTFVRRARNRVRWTMEILKWW